MTWLEVRGFWVCVGVVLAILLFLRLYRGKFAIERGTGKVTLFREQAS